MMRLNSEGSGEYGGTVLDKLCRFYSKAVGKRNENETVKVFTF